jgi:hypothetical protein
MSCCAQRPRKSSKFAAMRFAIGSGFAKCAACQGEDFYPAFPFPPHRREVLVCATCESEAVYSELIGKPGARLHRTPKTRES